MINEKLIDCPKCWKKIAVPEGKCTKFQCPSCKEQLEYDDRPESEKTASPVKKERGWTSLGITLIRLIAFALSIPLFIIAHKLLPDPEWVFHIDRVLIGMIIFLFLRYLFKEFRNIVYIAFFVSVAFLSYGSFAGDYGFRDVYKDYKDMLRSMLDDPHPEQIILSKFKPFPNKSLIIEAVDNDDAKVRKFALEATKQFRKYYDKDEDYRTIIQCLAIFKEINSKWNYVHDPKSREYFAKASESVDHLSGDCDDHSILMVACIRAIGGTARMVRTNGHIYPELLIGNKHDLKLVDRLIKTKLFPLERGYNKLHYHIDADKQVWLNLDYTAKYPGGEFMSEEIFGILNFS